MPEADPAAVETAPPGPQIILGFDFGRRRVGVAVGNTLTARAQPRPAIHRVASSLEPVLAAIGAEIAALHPARLVVGRPYNVDGSAHALERDAARFAAALQQRFALPVHRVDERYSSLEAEAGLRTRRADGRGGRIVRGAIDSSAAAVIVERWLAGEGER
ncbi:MAG: Holliday junction resolvase RuvX [Steroidobacteraceae bacterium]